MGEPVASQKAPYKTQSSPKSCGLPTPAFLWTKGGFFDESVPTYPCLYGGHAVGRYLPRICVGPRECTAEFLQKFVLQKSNKKILL